MTVRVSKTSRLRFGKLLYVGAIECWEVLDLPKITPQADDLLYTVKDQDRIDLLATKFYGDPVLWWIIAAANDLEILPTHLNTGDQLTIPSPRYVTQVLFSRIRRK